MDEKLYKSILVRDISYKTLIGVKPLFIKANKIDGFIRVQDAKRYLVLFGPEKYDIIYDSIIYLKSLKTGITYVISHNYARIKVDSYDALPLEKTLNLHNVIILIKSVFNKDQRNYYYNVFLKKCSYPLAKE